MSKYSGPSPLLSDGEPLSASVVGTEFGYLASSLNNVDKENWPPLEAQVLSNRSVHHDALVAPFRQGQLVEDEPATFVFMGRGGTTKTKEYSLGEYENRYTIDGCCTRVTINRDSLVKVDAFVQFDAIKISNQTTELNMLVPPVPAPKPLHGIDLAFRFRLNFVEPGGAPITIGSIDRRITLKADPSFKETNVLRRGFSVSVSGSRNITGVDPNGGAFDFYLDVDARIEAVSIYEGGIPAVVPYAIDDPAVDYRLFLAHARSKSRYISARAFVLI